ncbi:MAG: BolA family transcriptional regulator [Gammaproteobacteria bacterium]|nr:BolA family transcriptional regulator [Gammaproteobacteria bacterium]NIR28849.1 BolA family transcriptional regulator [Gammaproteobacteria bacterium]NIR97230.1 BolA family transcriptional regulator [Gammaproteobacteria bacterium]NIT62941.1 BolA family transcriptional regulator [Gammaproteobacteria bacterium]NIV20631.1 BolA/IbaG family iron-sulfur metabolism protein [Gammaproteobacteria bacterium]
MSQGRIELIRDRLTAALEPDDLEVVDESHRHAGHEGAKAGGGHFQVRIVARAFSGKPLLERHRMVYDALGDAMDPTTIHALGLKAYAPEELAQD